MSGSIAEPTASTVIGPTGTGADEAVLNRFTRAVTWHQAGHLAEAGACYRDAIALRPDLAEIYNNLGVIALDRGQAGVAVTAHLRAALLKPDFAEALFNLGNALNALGQREQAVAAYREALGYHNDFAEAYSNLGTVLFQLGGYDAAVAAYRQAIILHPGLPDPPYNLGNVLQALQQFGAAVAAYDRALVLDPENPELWSNRSTALRILGRVDAAVEGFRVALSHAPGDPQIHLNFAMALLHQGQFADGWREYEWRWKTEKFRPWVVSFALPEWTGESLSGKTVLLYTEQGFGDALMFARFAPVLAATGARVVVRTLPSLVRLLRTLPGVTEVAPFETPYFDFDYHLPLMSVPHRLGIDLDSIPATIPYLWAEATAVAAWRARLAAAGPNLKVGVVWAGDPRRHDPSAHSMDQRRSLGFDRIASLARIPGVTLVSLQKGEPPLPALDGPILDGPILDWMDSIVDFADTAALVTALDLVITVDTAVAHLAGALGKPVWILSRFDGCWRWLRDRDDTPWYPTARLFRQHRAGDWDDVMTRVAEALRAAIATDATPIFEPGASSLTALEKE
ncbi:MAG: tetratricopeptide repeat-containing glycosyltransferase family protein [Azospirillaceae bacterium]|nr:tetratricopeptide repeat-containing glycosyltransferase family protein [Azospirillaceae bacterium]